MATAEPPSDPSDPSGETVPARRRWLLLGGPVVVLSLGAAVLVAIALLDRTPAPPPEPDPVAVDASSIYDFATVEDMVGASDLVVRARVVATERGDLLGADGNDPSLAGVQVREVTLQVDEVWWPAADDASSGAPSGPTVTAGDRLVVAEEGWLASGEPLVVDGLAPSSVGDDGVWFLQTLPDTAPAEDGGASRYLVVNSQGRYLVDGESLTGARGDDPLVVQVERLTLGQLRDQVSR